MQRSALGSRVSLPELDAVWITHAHADHIGGLPLLIQASWLHGRSEPLPLGVPRHLSAPLRVWLDTILLSSEVTRYPLEIFSWQSGQALAMDDLAVRPFPTTHLDGFRKMTGKLTSSHSSLRSRREKGALSIRATWGHRPI